MQENEVQNSYLPLFRKYRPQSFKDVIGQEFTVKALENAIKLNKIANAYLFCGPRGTGKTSSARIFAKSLNCMEGPTVTPCQKCQSCLDVTNASGLDVIEIDAATNRGIDDAKELINKVQYAPMNGKYKIFIIDEVHMLSKEAFNALLKTFEEPPKNVIFILATTEPHKVIETIVSRCQRFDFRRITIDDIVKRLREISDIEKINIDDEALYTIAKNVSGGMRDSLALLDQASVLGTEKKITKETIEDLIGKITFDVLYNLIFDILSRDIEKAVQDVEKIYEKGSEPRNFIENFIEFLKNIILILSSKNDDEAKNLTLIDIDNIKKVKNEPLFNQTKIIKILDKIVEYYKEIKISTNPYLWAELAVINVCSVDDKMPEKSVSVQKTKDLPPVIKEVEIKEEEIKKETPKEEIREEIKEETKKTDIEEIKKEAPIETKEEIKPSLTNENDPAKIWIEILNKVESIPAKFFYSGVGKLVNISQNLITLGFVNQNAIIQAKSDSKYNPLLKAIKSVLGNEGNIEFITVTKDTKIIDTKLNVKISTPAQNQTLKTNSEIKENIEPVIPSKTEIKKTADEETDISNKENTKNYTKVTQDMLEAYSGRVIE